MQTRPQVMLALSHGACQRRTNLSTLTSVKCMFASRLSTRKTSVFHRIRASSPSALDTFSLHMQHRQATVSQLAGH